MWTQLQSVTNSATALRKPSRAGLPAIIACTLGLIVAADAASAQSASDGDRNVQPNAAAAARHRAPVTGTDALVDAAVVPTPALRTVRQDTRAREAAKVQNSSQSKPLNRTAQAYLGTSRQTGALPPVAMICEDCDPAPPCRTSPSLCQNSSIVDGAAIAGKR